MIHIAIVEDDAGERSHLRSCIGYYAENNHIEYRVSEFRSGLELLGNYKPVYDIILMDIDMPGLDGMKTAHAVREMDRVVLLVFVTNLVQYAIEGYAVDALDYILKPISKYDFALKFDKAVSRTAKRKDEAIKIRTVKDVRFVRIATIRYLEVSGHYIVYHTTEGDYTEYCTLKAAEQRIGKPFFVRCNRYLTVNLKFVTAVEGDRVLVGSDPLPLSRSQKKGFLDALTGFIGGSL